MPDTRKRILDAATELFAAQGYERTSIREIAERADVTPPLIHHHYKSKAELLHAVVKMLSDWAIERRGHLMEEMADESLEERVRGLLAQTFEMGCTRPEYMRIMGMITYSDELWEEAELSSLVWTTLAINLGPTVQEYQATYPERGIAPVVQTAVGVFGACLATAILGFNQVPPPKGMTQDDIIRRWRDRMTENYMRLLFPPES